MSKPLHNVVPLLATELPAGPYLARYVGNDASGRPLVQLDGAGSGSIAARCLEGFVGWPAGSSAAEDVLVTGGVDATSPPLILGRLRNTASPAPVTALLDGRGTPKAASVDGQRLVLEASREVVLKCGQGSITIEASGRIVIRGTELVSRASGSNKIRGASVSIN